MIVAGSNQYQTLQFSKQKLYCLLHNFIGEFQNIKCNRVLNLAPILNLDNYY